MNALKTNKFKVGDEVEIVKLDKTIQHFGGEEVLSPVGTKTFVTYVDVTGEEVEIDEDIYSYHASDLVLVDGKEETQTYNPLKENKFRVGDKVQVVSLQEEDRGECTVPVGSVGIIEDYIEGEQSLKYTVEFREAYGGHYIWSWGEDNLELFKETQDNVNSPNHYTTTSIECIVAMEAMLSPEEFIGYLRGNIFKYQWRYKQKNGVEDLKKAQWYQNKLLEKEST